MNAIGLVTAFDPANDGLASKSKELILNLLNWSLMPYSRAQFTPGHITCTAAVTHPTDSAKVLFIYHHRLHRWLLPGGHVEPTDESLADAAAREAVEETTIRLDPAFTPYLAGIDVHGIPAKKEEPFHLHHDLIWCFRATSEIIATTDEAPQVRWARKEDWDSMQIAVSIRNSIDRSNQWETK